MTQFAAYGHAIVSMAGFALLTLAIAPITAGLEERAE